MTTFLRAFPILSIFTAWGWTLMLFTAMGCAWTPRQMVYPDGLVIIRGDQALLDSVCPHTDDKGVPMGDRHAAGCYDGSDDTIYLLNNCVGAEALPHELGHREGLADPEAAGLNW